METEKRVETWRNIAAYFPYHEDTVRKKYGREMLEAGYVFKSHVGKGKEPLIWTFPSLIKSFISKKQATQGFV